MPFQTAAVTETSSSGHPGRHKITVSLSALQLQFKLAGEQNSNDEDNTGTTSHLCANEK